MKVLKHLLISGFIATFGIASAQAEFTRAEAIKLAPGQISTPSEGTARNKGSDIYIVQMKSPPAVAYEGDVAGYAATKPAPGKKLNENPAAVKKYSGLLMSRQNDLIQSIGAEKVYNYVYSFNGFAARMSAEDARALKKQPDVVNVWQNEIRQLDTNGSVDWIGVTQENGAWYKGYTGEDVVIASIDTGAWPENPSFADIRTPILGNFGPKLSLNPIPDDFTPSGCDFGNAAMNPYDADFTCTKKLVSARCYNSAFSSAPDPTSPCGFNGSGLMGWEFHSARDPDGHGSHTAGTAGGNYGTRAISNGERLGRVTGVAPRARLAFYKVCWDGQTGSGCGSADSMAAIDDAVIDGADVINFSVGGSSTIFNGPDDIAFLFAADAGVHVATSNGNSGPAPETTGTPAGVPWLTAVGASQDDGAYFTELVISAPESVAGTIYANEGSGSTQLIDTGPISGDIIPISSVTACNGQANDPIDGIALVSRGACSFTDKFLNAAAAGASAIIVYNNTAGGLSMSVGTVPIPGISITQDEGQALVAATGVTGTMSATSAANQIAGFSSRGPNGGAPDMIKPDVSAPGVSILAAYSPWNGADFASIGGTSMASPHVAGAFALLKQANPDWTPAQSKSAVMTTARQDLYKTYGLGHADPFDMGAGEIVPTDALKPGLTYDAGLFEYVAFLCGVPEQRFIFGEGTCNFIEFGLGLSTDPSDLNTASIAIADLLSSQTVTRTVTNVAYGKEGTRKERRHAVTTYYAHVDAPDGVEVLLSDWELELKGGESATYEIYFRVKKNAAVGEWAFGSLTWKTEDGKYVARSPIAVRPSAIQAAEDSVVIDNGTGTGTFGVPVQFGYTGEYNTSVSGLQDGFGIESFVDNDGFGTDYWCWNVSSDQTHLRLRTWDQDVTTSPGVDDLDMEAFLLNGDCSNATAWTRQLGSSGGVTSNELIDIFEEDLTPGLSIYVEVDYYSSVSGTIEYEMWFQGVFGDTDTTSVDAPSQATAGETEMIEVDYDIPFPGRWLGILHHEDADSEIARTILELDAETNAP